MVSEPLVIEFVTQIVDDTDPKHPELAKGRLILGPEGVFFIAAKSHFPTSSVQLGAVWGGIVGALAGAAVDAVANRGPDDVDREFEKLHRSVRESPPREQMEKLPGSFCVPDNDIESIKLRFLGPLEVLTASTGERYRFRVSGMERGKLKRWIAARAED